MIIAPIIHLNGDRPEVLIERLYNAIDSINDAMDVLRVTAPNGRNYYPNPGLMTRAEAQHRERSQALLAVAQSLLAEIRAIEEQASVR